MVSGLSTFVHYVYLLSATKEGRAVDVGEKLWAKIDPTERWKQIYGSRSATSNKELILFLYQPLAVEEQKEHDKYWMHIEGEFVYTAFPRPMSKLLRPRQIEIPEAGTMNIACACSVSTNLVVEKKESKYIIELNIILELTKGINPQSDKLIQDVSVLLRSLVEKTQESLAKLSTGQVQSLH
jgi:hypothetical protein